MINITPDELMPILKTNKNLFITGSAGSGKSYLASQFMKSSSNAVITATTGVAALNIGGETIHRFLLTGISTRPEDAGKIIGKWDKTKKCSTVWDTARWEIMKNLKTLIIDEISMCRRDQFELIDVVLSFVKDNPLPFGGIQIVAIGDLFQLSPVVTSHDAIRYKDLKDPYCFQSNLWGQAGFESYNLTTNFRQGEGEFLSALEQIRVGNITKEIEDLLNSRVGVKLNVPMEPVKLFAHKDSVSQENFDCLKKLPGDKYVSEAEFEGKDYDIEILKKECPAETSLYFGKGAQVMMLTNDPNGRFANGTLGIIRSNNPLQIQLSSGLTITPEMHAWERTVPKINPITKEIETHKVAVMKQYPFKLAYSTSIHKSQGLSLDYVDIDLRKVFACGQGYVALSRCRTLGGLTLRGWNKKLIKADKRVLDFYNNGV